MSRLMWMMVLIASVGCQKGTRTCTDGTAFDDAREECSRCLPSLRRVELDGGFRCVGADGGDGDAGDFDAGACGLCTAPAPHCDETAMRCVECTSDTHCSAPEGTCGAAGECVECETSADCDDPMNARCEMGACVPCVGRPDCMHLAGLGVCDAGECVECTAGDASGCGASPCTSARVCSDYGRAQDTCERCDTDDNCGEPDEDCVPMQYDGMDRAGGYCLLDRDLAGGCAQPYSITLAGRTTLSGRTGGRFCGLNEALATCEAVRALIDNATCAGGTDAECPQPSGICREVGGLMNRCTYPCGGAVQCDESPNPGSTCGDGGTGGVDYCGG